jgi:hypothetical protein
MLLLIAAALIGAFVIFGGGFLGKRRLDAGSAHQRAFAVIHEAMVQFAMLNKRLPCPANGGSGTSTNGVEDPATGAMDCPSPIGVVPWTTLGLPVSAATDSFGRLFSYRVFDGSTGFTRTNGLSLTDCLDDDDTEVIALAGGVCNATTHENTRSDFFAAKGFTVDDRGTTKGQIAYVLMSHGPSGYGAYLPDPSTTMAAPPAGGKEAINASDSTTYWILDINDTAMPDNANHFDDVLSYKNVNDLVVPSKIGGRPWPISARLDESNVGPYVSNNKISNTAYWPGPASTRAAITVSASASSARSICKVTTTQEGIAPCLFTSFAGDDRLTTIGDERLSFEFRLARRFLRIKLTHFRVTGSNYEKAKFTFYNGTTQVHEVVKTACDTSVNEADATGRFLIDPSAQFTRVEVRADDSSTPTDFAISSISGCKQSDTVYCTLPETIGTECP